LLRIERATKAIRLDSSRTPRPPRSLHRGRRGRDRRHESMQTGEVRSTHDATRTTRGAEPRQIRFRRAIVTVVPQQCVDARDHEASPGHGRAARSHARLHRRGAWVVRQRAGVTTTDGAASRLAAKGPVNRRPVRLDATTTQTAARREAGKAASQPARPLAGKKHSAFASCGCKGCLLKPAHVEQVTSARWRHRRAGQLQRLMPDAGRCRTQCARRKPCHAVMRRSATP
jgi:hypothetical protein